MSVGSVKTKEADFATVLASASRRVSGKISGAISADGLTLEQWSVLAFLARSDSPATMSEIARALGLSGPSLTRAADKLVTAALVFREVDPDDRRRVLMHASKHGQETHNRLRPRVEAVEKEIMASVPDVKEFFAALDCLAR